MEHWISNLVHGVKSSHEDVQFIRRASCFMRKTSVNKLCEFIMCNESKVIILDQIVKNLTHLSSHEVTFMITHVRGFGGQEVVMYLTTQFPVSTINCRSKLLPVDSEDFEYETG